MQTLIRHPSLAAIRIRFQELTPKAWFLDSAILAQYGPAGFGAAEASDPAGIIAGVDDMVNDTREPGDRDQRPADEAMLSARLRRLGERLGQHDRPSDSEPGPGPSADPSAIARGFRLSTELVAGVLVGAAIGWLIDRGVGTSPWGMIVFLLLGFAAGVLNVMRAAGVVKENRLDPPDRGK